MPREAKIPHFYIKDNETCPNCWTARLPLSYLQSLQNLPRESFEWPDGCASPVLIALLLNWVDRMLAYIPETSMVLLSDGHVALFVDISLCLNPHSSMPWLRERNSVIMTMGNLEESEHPFPLPILPLHARKSEIDPYLVLRAIVVTDSLTLDLRLWNKAIEEREKLAAASSAKRTTPSDIGSVR